MSARKKTIAGRPSMPGYGIADAEGGKGLLPWSWARKRLEAARHYWITTTRPDGRPHAMPVWGIWVDDVLYFSTGRDSRKSRNLQSNPACVVGIEAGTDAVIVEGVAGELQERRRISSLSKQYSAKYGMLLDPSLGPVYAVRPAVVFGFIDDLDEFAATATRWKFS